MKLNPDCIRDILLYVESKIDSSVCSIEYEKLIEALPHYDENTLHYHVNQISKSDLVDSVFYFDDKPQFISDLSPSGHEFLANIRSQSNWNKTKSIATALGISSLTAIKEISIQVVSELIKNQLK